jgi:hypothetical protein
VLGVRAAVAGDQRAERHQAERRDGRDVRAHGQRGLPPRRVGQQTLRGRLIRRGRGRGKPGGGDGQRRARETIREPSPVASGRDIERRRAGPSPRVSSRDERQPLSRRTRRFWVRGCSADRGGRAGRTSARRTCDSSESVALPAIRRELRSSECGMLGARDTAGVPRK